MALLDIREIGGMNNNMKEAMQQMRRVLGFPFLVVFVITGGFMALSFSYYSKSYDVFLFRF